MMLTYLFGLKSTCQVGMWSDVEVRGVIKFLYVKCVDVVNVMGTALVHAFDNERTFNVVEDRQLICMPRCVHNG